MAILQLYRPKESFTGVYSVMVMRRRLLNSCLQIGINYTGQANALKGCQNDAKNIRKFLMGKFFYCACLLCSLTYIFIGHGYKKEDIVLLTDDSSNPRSKPTRRNMIDGMKWLVKDAKTHDSLFFHCECPSRLFAIQNHPSDADSGHGGRTPDKGRFD